MSSATILETDPRSPPWGSERMWHWLPHGCNSDIWLWSSWGRTLVTWWKWLVSYEPRYGTKKKDDPGPPPSQKPKVLSFHWKKRFYLFLERGKGREKERREASMSERSIDQLLLHMRTTQACGLTGNWMCDLLLCRMTPKPLSTPVRALSFHFWLSTFSSLCTLTSVSPFSVSLILASPPSLHFSHTHSSHACLAPHFTLWTDCCLIASIQVCFHSCLLPKKD